MKYLCLIYDDEKKAETMSKSDADAFMGEYFAFTEAIKASGNYVGGEALKPVQTATTGVDLIVSISEEFPQPRR